MSVLDAAKPDHDRKQVSQEEVGWMVFPIGVMGPVDVELEKPTQAKRFAK